MWRPVSRYLAFASALFALHVHAASFGCDKARGRVEAMICEDDDLSELDELLVKTYKLARARSPDPDALTSDQKRWVAEVRRRCKDAECLSKAYDGRIAALEKIWTRDFMSAGQTSFQARAGQANIFDGVWQHCQIYKGEEVCSYYTLVQHGKQVCGESLSWATYRLYPGQLQATMVSSRRIRMDLMCGDLSAGGSAPCGDDSGGSGSWERAEGQMAICDGQLTELRTGQPCGSGGAQMGYSHSPLSERHRKELLGEPWVKACLARE